VRFVIELDVDDGEGDYYPTKAEPIALMRQLCAIVGHRPGDEREETEVPTRKVFRWRNCVRCWVVTHGKQPSVGMMVSATLERTYDPALLAAAERAHASFYDSVSS
jgi:hypothetical protein